MSDGTRIVDEPDSLPDSITEGLQKQDTGTVIDTLSYAQSLIDEMESIDDEELEEKDGEILSTGDVDERGSWTKVVKRIPCGKECTGCPHGPYLYLVQRRNIDRLEWMYVGKAVAGDASEIEIEFDGDDVSDQRKADSDDDDDDGLQQSPDEDIVEKTYPDSPDDS